MFKTISSRVRLALVAVTVSLATPILAQAQPANRGQVVEAVAKLNQAQMALAKRLAGDPIFAKQFDDASATSNYDAIATLVSSASGVPKSNVHVSPKGVASTGPERGENTNVVFRQASLVSKSTTTAFGGAKVCFDFGVIWGCIGL